MSTVDPSADAANAVARRYLTAVVSTHETPEFEWEELQPVLDFVRDKFTDHRAILHVYEAIQREFARGYRCSVCGRTVKQNAALGYDCGREC